MPPNKVPNRAAIVGEERNSEKITKPVMKIADIQELLSTAAAGIVGCPELTAAQSLELHKDITEIVGKLKNLADSKKIPIFVR